MQAVYSGLGKKFVATSTNSMSYLSVLAKTKKNVAQVEIVHIHVFDFYS